MDWLGSNTAGGALGIGLAALLAALLFVALPRGERYLARAPLLLIAAHVIIRWIGRHTEQSSLDARLLTFFGIVTLFGSIARSAFLLAVMSRLARARELSRASAR